MLLLLMLACGVTGNPDPTKSIFDGKWSNELGSVAIFNIASQNGTVSGSYYSEVGPTQGTYKITGVADGNLIAWIVLWRNNAGDLGSVTSWVGEYYPKTATIETVWTLRQAGGPNWNSTETNTDSFTRI